jgi:hypothetical protein
MRDQNSFQWTLERTHEVRSVADVLVSVTADGRLTLHLFQYKGVDYSTPDDARE